MLSESKRVLQQYPLADRTMSIWPRSHNVGEAGRAVERLDQSWQSRSRGSTPAGIALDQRGDGGTELRALPRVAAGTRLKAVKEPH